MFLEAGNKLFNVTSEFSRGHPKQGALDIFPSLVDFTFFSRSYGIKETSSGSICESSRNGFWVSVSVPAVITCTPAGGRTGAAANEGRKKHYSAKRDAHHGHRPLLELRPPVDRTLHFFLELADVCTELVALFYD